MRTSRPFPSLIAAAALTLSLAAGAGAQITLSTTFASNNGLHGNMFDLVALNHVLIGSFDVNLDAGTYDVSVYVRTGGGSHQGFETLPGAWTLVDTAEGVVSNGTDVPTPLDLALDVEIPAGGTQGFYVTVSSNPVGAPMNYTNSAVPVGSIFVSDANLRVLVGTGNFFPFGSTAFPRIWNGTVHYATVIEVPGDVPTIQGAINAATNDAVLVDPGTYFENIDFLGKPIRVHGRQGASQTRIDGTTSGPVVRFDSGEGSDSILDGFMLVRGLGGASEGGGIHCDSTGPTIRDCIIASCRGGNAVAVNNPGGGGGMHSFFGTPTIERCTFNANIGGNAVGTGIGGGGGLHVRGNADLRGCLLINNTGGSSPSGLAGAGGISVGTLSFIDAFDCELSGNQGGVGARGGAGGVLSFGDSGADFVRCRVIGNTGGVGTSDIGGAGGYDCANAGSVIVNCVIRDNTGGGAVTRGGAGGITIEGDSGASIVNSTITGNTGGAAGLDGPGGVMFFELIHSPASMTNTVAWGNPGLDVIDVPQGGPNAEMPDVTFCDVQGGFAGMGNINADPLFVDPGADDYHLQTASPCVDAGTSGGFFTPDDDFDGDPRPISLGHDIGADEVSIPVLAGTGEDFVLEVLVNNASIFQAGVNDFITVHFFSPNGTFNATIPALIGQIYANGSPPLGLGGVGFPEIHVDIAQVLVLFDGSVSGPFGPTLLPPGGITFLNQIQFSPVGLTTRLQALAITPMASNGFFAASGAHDIVFQ